MKSAVFLSIREKAKRLPSKSTRPIAGRPAADHLIARLKLATLPDAIIMTTSSHVGDDVLENIATNAGIACFRGSEDDKLMRYRDAARAHDVDFMVIVDGDDLFCSEEHIDRAIDAFVTTGADYITQSGLPLGAASFAVSKPAIERVCALKAETDTEVWGAYFTETGMFSCHVIDENEPLLNRPDVRMTLDYEEDLAFFTAVIEAMGARTPPPSFREIMRYITAHPQVAALNAGVRERYDLNLRRATPVRLRG
jgi:spore coat polysaccharide biosynthesis protein SpsF (cytidylyltransferase family)